MKNTLNVFHFDCECTSIWSKNIVGALKLATESNVFKFDFSQLMSDLCLHRSVVLPPSHTMVGELVQMTAMNIDYRDCCYTGIPGENRFLDSLC